MGTWQVAQLCAERGLGSECKTCGRICGHFVQNMHGLKGRAMWSPEGIERVGRKVKINTGAVCRQDGSETSCV